MKKCYYKYIEYEDCYPILFQRIKNRLIKTLGSLSKFAKIEHFGSSSVPKLGGKGLIDIIISLPKNKMKEARDLLVKAGYKWEKEADWGIRYFFRKNYVGFGNKREMHVSITFKSGWMWQNTLATRNYLRTHPNDMKKYCKIKKEGARIAKGKGEKYRKHKSEFLLKITKKATGLKKYINPE